MNQLYRQLVERKAYLLHLQEEIVQQSKNMPQGRLRVSNEKGIARYFHVKESGDTHGEYIPMKEVELVRKLAQKAYLHKLYRAVNEELCDIEKYMVRHDKGIAENVYSHLNSYRKELVMPLAVSNEEYIKKWQGEKYETNPYYPEEKVYSTKKDELVRSKSEVLLADMFYELGIPYRYEARLQFKNGKVRYPDFTLLNVGTREVIYHEHMGLLDDDEYRKAALCKLDEYSKNGIFLGKNLIITYEAEGFYLNIKTIKEQVLKILGV